jgi:hypothetical protein
MRQILFILGLLASCTWAQTTTTIPGTVKDLTNTAVTSGKVTLTTPTNQTDSGTKTFTGNEQFIGMPYFVNPGASKEIGGPLNTCIATFSSAKTPGVCIIAPGNYELTQTVIKPQWVQIEGNNAVISVSSLSTPAIICATTQRLFPTIAGTYARRGIANLTLIGNGPGSTPYGIWLGGDPTGTIISPTAQDFMEVFDNVHVQNFGAQYELGGNISQDLWVGGSIMGGYASAENGVVMAAKAGGSENLTFSGTQFIAGGGNTGFAILVANANGSTINLDHVSVDYWGSGNSRGCPHSLGTGQVEFNNGHLVVDGGHFETCSGLQILSNTDANVQISIVGGTEFGFEDTKHALVTPAAIQVQGASPQVTVEAGTNIGIANGATQTVSAYVNNAGSGGQVFIGQYFSAEGAGYTPIPPVTGPFNAGLIPQMSSAGSLVGYRIIGNLQYTGDLSTGNCRKGGASGTSSPAACGSASAGMIAVPASQTSFTVNTTAVNANSEVFVQQMTDNSALPSGPNCSSTSATPLQSARLAGASFTFTLTSVGGVTCFKYWIVN